MSDYLVRCGIHDTISLLISDPMLRKVVREVFEGVYGNGDERKELLADFDYNYNVVQAAVNLVYFYETEGLKL